MYDVLLFVIAEHMRFDYALDLGVEMREKVRVAEQNPVEEDYIIYLHNIEHCDKSSEELKKSEAFFHAVPYAEDERACKQQERYGDYCSADDVCAVKTFFFIGDNG